MTKRIISLILSLAMVLSLFTGLSFTASAANVTSGFTPASAGSYSKVTDVSTLSAGDEIIIVDESYSMAISTTQNGNNRAAVAVTIDNDAITVLEDNNVQSFILEADEGNDAFYLRVGEGLYLYAPNAFSGSKNYLRSTNVKDDAHSWVIAADAVAAFGGTARYILHYNTDNGGIFSAYNTAGAVAIFRLNGSCDHQWGEWSVTTAPTCTEAGVETRTCSSCGAAETRPVAALGHNYVNGVCSRCGASQPLSYVLADSIRAGDQIVFVDQTAKKAAGPVEGSGNTYLSALDAVIDGNSVTCENALAFEVVAGTAANTFAFKNGDHFLTASIAASSSNYLYLTADEQSAATDWAVTFNDGTAAISYCSSTAPSGRYLRYNVNTNGNPRFSGYTSSSSSIRDVSIYKLDDGTDLVDVYVVDQTNSATFNAYVYNKDSATNDGTAWPGHALECLGKDYENNNYYKFTVDRAQYNAVTFNNGNGAQNSDENRLLLSSDMPAAIAVFNNESWKTYYAATNDVFPASSAVVVDPTCTEGGYTYYTGVLGTTSDHRDLTDALGHAWGTWTSNGDNTHSRVCANDPNHVDVGDCVDENGDKKCEVCGGEMVPETSERYVIAANINGQYVALPKDYTGFNPSGSVIQVQTDPNGNLYVGRVTSDRYGWRLTNKGAGWTIDNGTKLIGTQSSTETGLQLSDLPWVDAVNALWTKDGTSKLQNVGAPNRGLIYKSDAARFGAYAIGNIDNQTYYDVELIPAFDSAEDITVYFVDETNSENAHYYPVEYPVADGVDTSEDLQAPGIALPGEGENEVEHGVDKGGFPYYVVSLRTDVYATVNFNNGGSGDALQKTDNLDYIEDARIDANGRCYVVYHIKEGFVVDKTKTDVWPEPGEVVTAPTCEQPGVTKYTGLQTGEVIEVETDPLDHDWGTPTYEWAADNSSVTATAICGNDPTHIVTETVATTFEVTDARQGTYTATFTNELFETQTKVENKEPLADGFYLIGSAYNWSTYYLSEDQKFEQNPNNTAEYMLVTDLSVNDQIKVVYVENSTIAENNWFPHGSDPNYVVDKGHSGNVTIYFQPAGNSAWSSFHTGGFFYIPEKSYVVSNSVNFEGKLGLYFYVHISDELLADPEAYAIIGFDGAEKKVLISSAQASTNNGITRRRFVQDVVAKKMREEITLRIYDGNDNLVTLVDKTGNDVPETGYVYSVMDYLIEIQEKGTNEYMKALAAATANYGTAAQIRFNYKSEGLNIAPEVAEVALSDLADYEPEYTGSLPEGIATNTSSIQFDEDNTVRQYFTLNAGQDINAYTFTLDGNVVTPVMSGENRYYVALPNVAVKDLDIAHEYSVTDGTNTYSFTFSPLSYAYKIIDGSTNNSMINLAKALFLYNQAANEYFAHKP